MKILLQLSDMKNFTPNEASIARYVLHQRERMLNLNIRELAQETYTSHSTVNRLTRKLGLSGFRAFMLGLAAEFQQENGTGGPIDPNYPFGLDESPAQIAREMSELVKGTVDRSAALLDNAVLAQTAEMLEQAERIFIYALGDSQIRAKSFQNKLMKINKYAIIATELSEWAYHTLNLSQNDCVIFLTYHGKSSIYPKIARHLIDHRIPFLTITSSVSSPLAQLSPILIRVPGDEAKHEKIGPFASQIAFEYVLNVLYSCIYNLTHAKTSFI
ncbi:MurR/RpiR family transcriptional regulator [Saccharibacillus sacchari]|uniref:MurR/RpiR family transcriptional regulator n=1 Tax=Saccharibacillus sacchari TaxID=456493 RepID=A0ACC6P6A8_9BACL